MMIIINYPMMVALLHAPLKTSGLVLANLQSVNIMAHQFAEMEELKEAKNVMTETSSMEMAVLTDVKRRPPQFLTHPPTPQRA